MNNVPGTDEKEIVQGPRRQQEYPGSKKVGTPFRVTLVISLYGKVWAGVCCIFNLLSLVLFEIIWWKNIDFYVFFHVFLADAYWDFHFLIFSVKWKVVQFMSIFFGKDTLNTDWQKIRKIMKNTKMCVFIMICRAVFTFFTLEKHKTWFFDVDL